MVRPGGTSDAAPGNVGSTEVTGRPPRPQAVRPGQERSDRTRPRRWRPSGSGALRWSYGNQNAGQDWPEGRRRRTRLLAAGRRLGGGQRGRRPGRPATRPSTSGVTFFDTADVYGDGRSEQLIARFRAARPDVEVTVATKLGRRADPFVPEHVHRGELPRLDRPQSAQPRRRHPRPGAAALPADGGLLRRRGLRRARRPGRRRGRSRPTASSVETCDEALTAIARPGVATVQIILNAFRHKPLERVLPAAAEAGVGIIARVPLASGLLSAGTTSRPRSPPTTTAPTTGTARRSTSARPSPGCRTRSGWRPPARLAALAPDGRVDGGVRAALDRRPARGQRGDPRCPQRRPGPRQRRGGGGCGTGRAERWPLSAGSTTSASARTCTTAGDTVGRTTW